MAEQTTRVARTGGVTVTLVYKDDTAFVWPRPDPTSPLRFDFELLRIEVTNTDGNIARLRITDDAGVMWVNRAVPDSITTIPIGSHDRLSDVAGIGLSRIV